MPLYQEKNLNCLTQITENLKVQIDINQFKRVFDNLIRNAINYSIENSDIIIGARQENDDIIITVFTMQLIKIKPITLTTFSNHLYGLMSLVIVKLVVLD